MEDIRKYAAIGNIEHELANKCARIRVIALDDGKRIIRDEEFIKSICPPKGMVFGPSFFNKYPKLLRGEIIRFRLAPNSMVFDLSGDRDETVVSEGTRVESDFGYAVIDTNGQELFDDHTINLDYINSIIVPADKHFYFFSRHGLTGPFKKMRNEVKPVVGKTVNRWPKFDKNDSSYISSGGSKYLLRQPTGFNSLVDCMTPKQLEVWLKSKLKLISDPILKKIQEGKEFKEHLGNLIREVSVEDRKELLNSRLERVETRLDNAFFERSVVQSFVEDSEMFQERFDEALEVHKEYFLKEAHGPLLAEIKNLEKTKEELIKAYKATKEQLEKKLLLKMKDIKEKDEEVEEKIKELEYLKENKDRLVKDFSILIPTINKGVSTNGSALPKIIPEEIATSDRSYPDFKSFMEKLKSSISNDWQDAESLAKQLAKTFALTRCMFIPESSLGIALAHCINHTIYLIQQVEPDWLRFQDFWENGLGTIWTSAQDNPKKFHFLILQDINLASPECWAKPLIDLWSGRRTTLPIAGTAWPDNLWVMATRLPSSPPYDIGLPVYSRSFPKWCIVVGSPKREYFTAYEAADFHLSMEVLKEFSEGRSLDSQIELKSEFFDDE